MPRSWSRVLVPLGLLLSLVILVPDVEGRGRGGGRGGGRPSMSRGGAARGGSMGRSHGGATRPTTYPGSSRDTRRERPASSGWWRGSDRPDLGRRPESRPSREQAAQRPKDSDKTREDRQERRDEREGPLEERRDENQEERRSYREQQQQERRDYAGAIYEERQEFLEHYSYPYWGYGYPYSGTRVFISINTYDSYACTKSTVVIDGTSYYRCDDGWYNRVSREGEVEYVAVPPPEGTKVDKLKDPQVVHAGGETYHLSNGVYYKELTKDGKTSYVVVDPPLGLEVEALPQGSKEQTIGGKTYHQYGKVFYRPVGDGKSYVIVPAPY